MDYKIALVTPLKDEMENIDRLIESISSQTIRIHLWVIVENGSVDGSKEYLSQIQTLENVDNFIILNFSLPNDTYELGVKYSTVVNTGFNYVLKEYSELDFIGICDADCFPAPNYYEKLSHFMKSNSLDISSGVGQFEDGSSDGEADDWVRGNCRLWTWACFRDAGYLVGPSADTLSLGKAVLKGYKTAPNHKLIYNCREMGSRTRYSYYGYSSYYRGITPFYALLKFINYIKVGQSAQGLGYLKGYFTSYFSRKPRLEDKELRKYFSKSLLRKLGFDNA